MEGGDSSVLEDLAEGVEELMEALVGVAVLRERSTVASGGFSAVHQHPGGMARAVALSLRSPRLASDAVLSESNSVLAPSTLTSSLHLASLLSL
jgi:hypothetical protein